MDYYPYTEEELDGLKAKDPILAKAIDDIPHIYKEVWPDPFGSLSRQIIGQQISNKALMGILQRVRPYLQPESILRMDIHELRELGISERKALTLKEIARLAEEGKLDKKRLSSLSDEEIIEELTAIKGIGRWTAEMFLLFCLERKSILSYGDYGIRKGIMMVYGYKSLSPIRFARIRKRLSPYLSLASLYFWEIAGTYK